MIPKGELLSLQNNSQLNRENAFSSRKTQRKRA